MAFCVWALLQDGLQVSPFNVHPESGASLRRAGMDAVGWSRWFETVVNGEVQFEERVRTTGNLEPGPFFESDPPNLADQQAMRDVLRAKTSPGMWDGPSRVGEVLDELWEEYGTLPEAPHFRPPRRPDEREEPGTIAQHATLYESLRQVGRVLPSVHCFPVVYPALVVRPVAPMALVLTTPRHWVWERYRSALLAGVERLAGEAATG